MQNQFSCFFYSKIISNAFFLIVKPFLMLFFIKPFLVLFYSKIISNALFFKFL